MNTIHSCIAGAPDTTTTAMVLYSDNAESVEWFNMCWRKVRHLTSANARLHQQSAVGALHLHGVLVC